MQQRETAAERDAREERQRKREAQAKIDEACNRVIRRAYQQAKAAGEPWPPRVLR